MNRTALEQAAKERLALNTTLATAIEDFRAKNQEAEEVRLKMLRGTATAEDVAVVDAALAAARRTLETGQNLSQILDAAVNGKRKEYADELNAVLDAETALLDAERRALDAKLAAIREKRTGVSDRVSAIANAILGTTPLIGRTEIRKVLEARKSTGAVLSVGKPVGI
jgi:hypothetical protein